MPDSDTNDKPSPQKLQKLQTSIRDHRRDLVASVGELERIVRAKLDVKARLRHAAQRGAARIEALFERTLERVRARPVPYLVIGGALLVMLFRRRPRREYTLKF